MRTKKTHEQIVQGIEAKRQKLLEQMKKLTEKERSASAKEAAETKKRNAIRSRRLGVALNLGVTSGMLDIDVVRQLFEKLPEGSERAVALKELASLDQDRAA